MKKIILVAVQISLGWNIILLGSSVLNLHWVLLRVSGGQYHSFPISVRLLNLVIALFSLYLINFAIQLYRKSGAWSQRSRMISLAVTVAFILSALGNSISKSPEETWNALPAAIVAVGFYILSRKSKFT